MTNEKVITQAVEQTYRYFYNDGLVELAIGLLFTLLGFVLLGWRSLGTTSWITLTVVAVTILFVLAAPWLVKSVVRVMKARVTYPRTGYVAYRAGEPGAGRWLVVGLALALALLVLLLPDWVNQMSVVVGLLLMLILGLMGYRVGIWRFYLIAAVAAAVGVVAALLGVHEIVGTVLTFVTTGVVLLLSGGLVLLAYLRQNRNLEDGVGYE